jgi:uncharacterized membrane protein
MGGLFVFRHSSAQSRSYELLFRHHATGFFCIALLSGCSGARRPLPTVRSLVWTTLQADCRAALRPAFRGSQQIQLLLVCAEILVSFLFLLSFWWTPHRLRYLWQAVLVLGAARHWA